MTNREVIYKVRPNPSTRPTQFGYEIIQEIRYDNGHVSIRVVDYSTTKDKAERLAEAYNRNGEDT